MMVDEPMFWIYLLPGLALLVVSAMVMRFAKWGSTKRLAARCWCLSPVWPLLLAYALFIGLRRVWRQADWKGEV